MAQTRKRKVFDFCKRWGNRLALASALSGAVAFGPHLYVASQDCLRGKEIEGDISQLEQTLSDKYKMNIKVWVEPPEGFERPPMVHKSSLKTHSPYMSLRALEGLEKAMSYYPNELLQKHLRGVEIVRAYNSSNEEIEKQGGTPVANMSFWGGMSISAGRDDFLRYHRAVFGNIFEDESFHHEIAHELTSKIPKEEWKAIHPDAVYNPLTWKALPSIPSGFFNKYSTHSIGEDIASTVELLYSKDYNQRISSDVLLRKKAEYLKKWYLKISNGAIDDKYWSSVQNGEIPTLLKSISGGNK